MIKKQLLEYALLQKKIQTMGEEYSYSSLKQDLYWMNIWWIDNELAMALRQAKTIINKLEIEKQKQAIRFPLSLPPAEFRDWLESQLTQRID